MHVFCSPPAMSGKQRGCCFVLLRKTDSSDESGSYFPCMLISQVLLGGGRVCVCVCVSFAKGRGRKIRDHQAPKEDPEQHVVLGLPSWPPLVFLLRICLCKADCPKRSKCPLGRSRGSGRHHVLQCATGGGGAKKSCSSSTLSSPLAGWELHLAHIPDALKGGGHSSEACCCLQHVQSGPLGQAVMDFSIPTVSKGPEALKWNAKESKPLGLPLVKSVCKDLFCVCV